MKPGIYPEITVREYFDECCPAPALTASGIKTLLGRTPAELFYEHPALNPGNDAATSSAAKRFGDVAHQLALGKGRGFAVGDFPAWQSKEAKEFKAAAEARGVTPVTRHEFLAAEATARIMKERIERSLALISGKSGVEYQTEQVMVWTEETRSGPIYCRAMMDVWCDDAGVILDPKFSKRMGDGVFEGHATNMGWDLQARWYLRGAEKVFPDRAGRLRFINPLVNPDPPHVSRMREADEATLYSVQLDIERAIERFGQCLHANSWPGYPDMIEPWTAKSYTMAERMARSIEEDG